MQTLKDLEQRLTDLEIKASFSEDLLDQLEQVILRQQRQIELLLRQVGQLAQPATDGLVDATRSPRDELPPHY
jgi:SlyX protein